MKKYNSFLGAFFSGDSGQGGYNAAYEKKSLANLYGGQLAPEQEQEALAGLNRVNPEAAGKWQEETVKQSAQLLLALGKDNPVAQQAWQTRIKPNLGRMFGAQAANLPDQIDDNIMAVAQQIAGGSQESADPAAVREVDLIAKRMGLTPGTPDYLKFVQTQYGLAPKATGWKYGETASGAPWRAEGDVYEVLDRDSGQWMPYGKKAEAPVEPPHNGEIKNDDGSTWASFSDMPIAEQEAYKAAEAARLGGSDAGYEVRGGKVAQIQQPTVRPRQDPFSKPQEQQAPPSGYRWRPDGTLEPIPGGAADPNNKDNAPKIAAVNSLRNDYQTEIKPYVDVMNAYEKMRYAAQDPSPAGDIALIYAYMKILDPTSVVREGEFATAQNAGSVPDSVRNTWNKLMNGERLAINRGDFLNQGAKLYASSKEKYQSFKNRYRGIAQRNGINTEDVIVDSHTPISQKFPAQGQVYKPQTDADFAKIPKGSIYIDPDDGKQYRK